MKKIITSDKAPAPIGPYNQAILAGNTLYVSGQIPFDAASGNLINGSIEEETHQVMKNLRFILEEAGMDFSSVVKCSIFIKNMDDFGKINEAYGSYFGDDAPARETVEVARLPKDVNVEISCIAVN
ncbi:RidA family protein [Limibacter armeniacum]|uniref:RidA family protein n=1 Tax=Limibacter armeniacum TaxID=466084 RepID=UPI002FE68C1E